MEKSTMPRTLTLPENTQGRDFVIGDLHGAHELLKRAMKEAKFDPTKDRVISVGDLVDRGPNSPDALWLLKQPWFFAVRGNHEALFLNICEKDGKLNHLAQEFNKSANGLDWVFKEKPETLAALREAFSKLPYAIEVKTDRGMVGFIHAEVPAGMDWATFKKKLEDGDISTMRSALLSRKRGEAGDNTGVPGIDRIFMGHTVQSGGVKQRGNCFYIDTGGVFRLMETATEPGLFLTFTDIRAETKDLTGPAEKERPEKVVTKAPPKGQPFMPKAA